MDRPGAGEENGAMVSLLPEEVKAVRKGLGLSQQALGDALGLSRVTVGQMERGRAPIERRTVLSLLYLAEHPEIFARQARVGGA